MKILKNNYNNYDNKEFIIKSYPRAITCDYCQSKLEYEKSDIKMGVYGLMYVNCPLCGYDNALEDNEENIVLNINNVEFPKHFYHTSKEAGAVDCCNNVNVKKYIYEAINYFRKNKEEYSYECHVGNLYICITKRIDDEVYDVIVSNDYYSTYIPFEERDY